MTLIVYSFAVDPRRVKAFWLLVEVMMWNCCVRARWRRREWRGMRTGDAEERSTDDRCSEGSSE